MKWVILKNYFIIFLIFFGCTSNSKKFENRFEENIRFNHLYVVIDDSTYACLFDFIQVLDDFSYNDSETVDTGEETWSGKYLFGLHHYLEIFNLEGYENAKIGELGLGFITDKSGTLNSTRLRWEGKKDSIYVTNREIVNEGQSSPWYQSISLPNLDSLRVTAWLMEHQKEEMIRVGFTDEDLQGVINWTEYINHSLAKSQKLSPDSIKFEKAFCRITSLYLTLTLNELEWLRVTLLDFGFTEEGNDFISQDITIKYEISPKEEFILNQIDFELMKPIKSGRYPCQNLELIILDKSARLKFLYNQ